MELFFYFFIFLFSLIVGSFLNVVIYRLKTGEQVVSGRSHCRRCKHILEWYDLLPVLSFLILGGKCRYCGKPFSWQYPAVEIGTGMLFVAIFNFQFSIFNEFSIFNFFALGGSAAGGQFLNFTFSFDFFSFLLSTFYFLFIVSALIVIFVYDLRHYIIPDKIIYPTIVVSLAYLALRQVLDFGHWNLFGLLDLGFGIFNTFLNGLFASILASGFFFAIVLFTRGEGMGGGDIKLAFLMGLILGWPNILIALFLAFSAGAICGIILILLGKKKFKSEIPFGPFLVAGTIISMLYGEAVIEWYSGYLF